MHFMEVQVSGEKMLQNIPLEKIRPNPWNCNFLPKPERKRLKKQMVNKPEGTPPIMVRKIDKETYEIIDGEQRWSIAQELGWSTIPTIVFKDLPDEDAKLLTLSYNKLRGNINWFKLSDLVEKGLVTRELLEKVLSGEEMANLEKVKYVDEKAKNTILKLVETHGWNHITLDHLVALAEWPASKQEAVGKQTVEQKLGPLDIKRELERQMAPQQLPTPSTPSKPQKEESREKEVIDLPPTLIEQKYVCISCEQQFTLTFKAGIKELKVEPTQHLEKVSFRDEVVFFSCPNCGQRFKADYDKKRVDYSKGFVEGVEAYGNLGELSERYEIKCPFCEKSYSISGKREEFICKCGAKAEVNSREKKVIWIQP